MLPALNFSGVTRVGRAGHMPWPPGRHEERGAKNFPKFLCNGSEEDSLQTKCNN